MTASPANEDPDALGVVQGLLQQGEVTKALETLDGLADTAKSSAMGQYMRGVCLRLTRDFANAESALRQLVDSNPSYGRVFRSLAIFIETPICPSRHSMPTLPHVISTPA